MGWRGIAAGALALIALSTLVQPVAAGRAAGLAEWAGTLARRFLDPTVPAIPDRAAGDPPGTTIAPAYSGTEQWRYPVPTRNPLTS